MITLKKNHKQRRVIKKLKINNSLNIQFYQKSINSIVYNGYLNVWEGAVRSSKTVSASIAFIIYVYKSPGNVFIASGKTIATLYRNVISPEYGILNLFRGFVDYKKDSRGNTVMTLIGRDKKLKTIYCFGANDERAYQILRGLTATGWFADEVNLHSKSFIEEAFKRTIVSTDRKHFWTLNPDNPYHFIYTDYIDKYQQEKLPGFWLWFFTLNDNPALSEERREELRKQYYGIFYKRYILGIRCVAEGIIYDMFDNKNIYNERPYFKTYKYRRYISMDYGTINPCVFLDIYDDGETIYIDREYYWDSKKQMRQKTDEEYAIDYTNFVEEIYTANDLTNIGRPEGILDPSASSFKLALMKKGYFITEANNEVENGIRRVATLLGSKKLLIHSSCANLIKELSTYSWNQKISEKGKEEPIKQNDHACDALRYFVNTRIPTWRVGE